MPEISPSIKFDSPAVKFVLLFVGLFGVSLITASLCSYVYAATMGATVDAASKPVTAPAFPKLAPTLETELRDAFEPKLAPSVSSGDPFVDHSNISATGTPPSVNVKGGTLLPPDGSLASRPLTVATPVPTPDIAAQTRARLAARDADRRQGRTVRPLAFYLSYKDVLPLGIVGNSDRRDVLFFSLSTTQTFAAQPGTRFFDAQLVSVSDDGVVFRDEGSVMHSIAWSRRPSSQPSASQPRSPASGSPSTSASPPSAGVAPTDAIGNLQNAVRDRYPNHGSRPNNR